MNDFRKCNIDDIRKFITTLCKINLSQNSHDVSNALYEELETLDIDLQNKDIKRNVEYPYNLRMEIVNLIELYYLNIDNCVNKYSDVEAMLFLKQLKIKAEKVYLHIM